jgi:PAS domain S-box-containing protein
VEIGVELKKKLQESENIFRSIVENSHAGIFIIDSSFRLTYANNMLSEILGYPVEEIVGSDFRRFLDEPSKILVADRYIRRQKGEDLPSRYEFSYFRRDGELHQAELSSAVVKDSSGRAMTVGQMLDITERKKAEAEIIKARAELEIRVNERTGELQKTNNLLQREIEQHQQTQEILRQSEIKHRHLIENANSIILEMDPLGNVIFMNNFGLKFFGFAEEELLGRSVVGTIVPSFDSAGKDLEMMIKDIVTRPEKYASNENENIKRHGERVWIVWTNRPILDEEGRLKEILCIGIDYTQQKLAEEIFARELKERTTSEERNRLARDLHDAVSQTLFSASIIADVLPRLWERDQTEARKRLEEVRQLTRGALAEMRTLLLELRPAALVDADIGELMRQLAESVTGRARIPVSVEINGTCSKSEDLKIALYRIAQEALNNVAKHSRATRAALILHCEINRIELVIRDDGKGFDINTGPSASLGLDIMRERAKDIGASLKIESRPGHGTSVTLVYKIAQRG